MPLNLLRVNKLIYAEPFCRRFPFRIDLFEKAIRGFFLYFSGTTEPLAFPLDKLQLACSFIKDIILDFSDFSVTFKNFLGFT